MATSISRSKRAHAGKPVPGELRERRERTQKAAGEQPQHEAQGEQLNAKEQRWADYNELDAEALTKLKRTSREARDRVMNDDAQKELDTVPDVASRSQIAIIMLEDAEETNTYEKKQREAQRQAIMQQAADDLGELKRGRLRRGATGRLQPRS